MLKKSAELLLIQVFIYFMVWMWDSYIGFFLSLIFASIAIFVLLVSLFAEMIDRSSVPKLYFYAMLTCIIAPIIASLLYILIMGKDFVWLKSLY